LIRSFGSCLVAYSGGVDSVFLAYVVGEVLGDRSLAVIADSPSLPRRELAEALEIAEKFRIPVRVVRTNEFSNADYLSNPTNRCYFCKHELFAELEPLAKAESFAVIAYGENASDVAVSDRPAGVITKPAGTLGGRVSAGPAGSAAAATTASSTTALHVTSLSRTATSGLPRPTLSISTRAGRVLLAPVRPTARRTLRFSRWRERAGSRSRRARR